MVSSSSSPSYWCGVNSRSYGACPCAKGEATDATPELSAICAMFLLIEVNDSGNHRLAGVPARYVRGYEDSAAVRPCHYELWLVGASGKS